MFTASYSNIPFRYTYQLQARCDSGALLQQPERIPPYNLPDWYSFGNISPSINNQGNIAFKVLGAWHQAVWYGTQGTGNLVYIGPRGASLGRVSLNNQDCLAWEQLRSRQNGLWLYDAATHSSSRLTTAPLGSCGWAAPTINDGGAVGFRAKFTNAYGFAIYSVLPHCETLTLALTSNLDPSSIYSFLFTPAFNNNKQIAAKVRLGQLGDISNERPDQIRIFHPDGDSTLIVVNQNHDTDSPYQNFDNSVGFNDTGQIAFIATLSSGQRGVFRFNYEERKTELIAIEGDGHISLLERFSPRLNNRGLVVFRAFDAEGLRAIWAADGVTLHKVVTEGDVLPTDLGALRLARPDNAPVFSGLPDLNDQGDIVFAACLADPENPMIGFGAGLFVAKPASVPLTPRELSRLWSLPEHN